jgi:Leucine-rich repeat (LRR) protein
VASIIVQHYADHPIRFTADRVMIQFANFITILRLNKNTHITNRSLRYLTNLTCLTLRSNDTITDSGLSVLTNLTTLDLYKNGGVLGISSFPQLTRLRTLSLHQNKLIGVQQLATLSESLTSLNLSAPNKITTFRLSIGAHSEASVLMPCLASLKYLNLSGNRFIGDKELSCLSSLTVLQLNNNAMVSDDGLRALPQLRELALMKNFHITSEALQQQRLPNLRRVAVDVKSRLWNDRRLVERGILTI